MNEMGALQKLFDLLPCFQFRMQPAIQRGRDEMKNSDVVTTVGLLFRYH
ncbi:unnamed protein product [Linum tenue]|uniref:Uncharacterized protein n=1 Tax=Linum tenue TaxID=586396 RepID=A0AAV0IFX1_9ROSI|nr:unnamed protein product [Linum tenue]